MNGRRWTSLARRRRRIDATNASAGTRRGRIRRGLLIFFLSPQRYKPCSPVPLAPVSARVYTRRRSRTSASHSRSLVPSPSHPPPPPPRFAPVGVRRRSLRRAILRVGVLGHLRRGPLTGSHAARLHVIHTGVELRRRRRRRRGIPPSAPAGLPRHVHPLLGNRRAAQCQPGNRRCPSW